MSKVTLYMAVSVDGCIATTDNNTDWVGDESWKSYLSFVGSCDVALVGRKTFEMMEKDEFIDGVKYFVVTDDQQMDAGSHNKITINVATDMPKADRIAIIGGGDLNGRLAKLGLIDEVILDVEPVLLGDGIRLFGDHQVELKLGLVSSKQIGPQTVQNHYEVL